MLPAKVKKASSHNSMNPVRSGRAKVGAGSQLYRQLVDEVAACDRHNNTCELVLGVHGAIRTGRGHLTACGPDGRVDLIQEEEREAANAAVARVLKLEGNACEYTLKTLTVVAPDEDRGLAISVDKLQSSTLDDFDKALRASDFLYPGNKQQVGNALGIY